MNEIVVYTPKEAAKLLRISRSKLYMLVSTGEIDASRPGGIRITHEALMEYLRGKKPPPEPEPVAVELRNLRK